MLYTSSSDQQIVLTASLGEKTALIGRVEALWFDPKAKQLCFRARSESNQWLETATSFSVLYYTGLDISSVWLVGGSAEISDHSDRAGTMYATYNVAVKFVQALPV